MSWIIIDIIDVGIFNWETRGLPGSMSHFPHWKLYCCASAQAAERGEIVTLWQLEMPTFEGFVKESKRNCHVYRFM